MVAQDYRIQDHKVLLPQQNRYEGNFTLDPSKEDVCIKANEIKLEKSNESQK